MFQSIKGNPSKKLNHVKKLGWYCCIIYFLISVILLYLNYNCTPETRIDHLRKQSVKHAHPVQSVKHAHPVQSVKHAQHDMTKNSLDNFEKCSWSGHKYLYPYWDNTVFENTVRALNEAGVVYFLTDGALIGAYRHGGPIPCDGDMDIVFPVWLNGLAMCEDANTPVLRGYEKNDESQLALCGKTREEYVVQTTPWLREHVPNIRSIAPRKFGGLRVNFAGIGVDWIVSILDQSYLHHGPICRCIFGSTEALCIEDSLWLIKSIYGDDVLTPLSGKINCIQREKTIQQNPN